MKRKQPSLLALHVAWFNRSTWLERLWTHADWRHYLDHSTLAETDGGARDGHQQKSRTTKPIKIWQY
jgi:hypothetical protein